MLSNCNSHNYTDNSAGTNETPSSANYNDADFYYSIAQGEKDPGLRSVYLERAAKQGHVEAQYELGLMNLDDALRNAERKYFTELDKRAQSSFVLFYLERAIDWFNEAHKNGHSRAKFWLDMIYESLAEQCSKKS